MQGNIQIVEASPIWLQREFEPLFLTNVSSYINKWHDLLYVPPASLQISELRADQVTSVDGVESFKWIGIIHGSKRREVYAAESHSCS